VQVIELNKGTPRSIGVIGLEAANKGPKSAGRLSYEIRDFPQFDKLKYLVPQNCFCGLEDIVPGLVNEKFPNPRQASGPNMSR